MGRLVLPEEGPVYVDANSAIYWLEKIEPFASATAPLWEAIEDQLVPAATGALTLLEVLVKPLREGNAELVETYRRVFLRTKGLECLVIDQRVLDLAASLRAKHRLKTPDAIHAATALSVGATEFLTNDFNFRKVPGLNVILLDDFAAPDPSEGSH